MKIAYDAKRLFSNYTGLGNYSRTLVQNLTHYYPNQQVHLFAPELRHHPQSDPFIHNKQFQIHESKSRIKAYWRSFGIVKDLIKANINVYHGLSNEIPHRIDNSGIRSVVSIHDLIFKIYPNTYSLSERIVYERKFKYACQHADKVIAISQNTKTDIIQYYQIPEEKIAVIYQACQPLFYQQQTKEQVAQNLNLLCAPNQYFIYVGSVEERKNLKLIIEAYRIHKELQTIPCLIVGRGGQYKKECHQLIAQHNLQQCFVWFDKLNDNYQLQSLYQGASALIYPSKYEGFGLPIAEALLCGTPVIAAKSSSLVEAGGPMSIYIDPNNAVDLSHAMLRVLRHPELLNPMKAEGLSYAQNFFSPEKLSEQLMTLYLSI